MYVGLKQPRGDVESYVTPAPAAAKETTNDPVGKRGMAWNLFLGSWFQFLTDKQKQVIADNISSTWIY